VGAFHFEAKELGQSLNDAELDELKRSRYGDVSGRKINLAESPAQLLLEAASTKQTSAKKAVSNVQQKKTTPKACVSAGNTTKNSKPQVNDVKETGGSVGNEPNMVTTTGPISGPVKQKEYRRPDGRKRIIPEVVGVPVQPESISSAAQQLNFPIVYSEHIKSSDRAISNNDDIRASTLGGSHIRHSDLKERSGVTARATISDGLIIEKVPDTSGDGGINVQQMGNSMTSNSLAACSSTLSIRVFDKKGGDGTSPVLLEARPREHTVNDIAGLANTPMMKETEIVCTRGDQTLWSDRISGKVTVLAGNANFWAVGCEDGCLQVNCFSTFIVCIHGLLFTTYFLSTFLI
jgi:protein HIRA/HIR1